MPKIHDVIVIGGGPAGLAATINASSEGLDTVLIDANEQLGGQASASSLVENYPGFPEGISGKELTEKFIHQATRFGAMQVRPVTATGISVDNGVVTATTDDAEHRRIRARAVILALGLSYNRLSAHRVADFVGRGVYYGGTPPQLWHDAKHVCVVGGANSSGQAAVHLASRGCEVTLVARSKSLEDAGMSNYLVERIKAAKNIKVLTGTVIHEAVGDQELESVVVRSIFENITNRKIDVCAVCVFIGASPKTYWLNNVVEQAVGRGYILTGNLVKADHGRPIYPFETSLPGVFACGDVREGSTKRIATAVGEGSMAVQQVKDFISKSNETR